MISVVIDETSVRDNLPLRLRQGAGGRLKCPDASVLSDRIGADDVRIFHHGFPDAGDKDVIAECKGLRILKEESGMEVSVNYLPARQEDVSHVVLAIDKIREMIDFQPLGIQEGIRRFASFVMDGNA